MNNFHTHECTAGIELKGITRIVRIYYHFITLQNTVNSYALCSRENIIRISCR